MDDNNNHECSQEKVMTTICVKLENIEADIKEIKEGHKVFMSAMSASQLNSAKYPSPEFVNKAIAKLDKHDLFFKIIWVALAAAWSVLLLIVGTWIKGGF